MRPHHYLAVIIRLFAIALFLYAIRQSGYLIQLFISGEINAYPAIFLQVILGFLIPFVLSLLLWFFPVIAAKSLLKPEMDQHIEAVSKISIFFVFVASLGLYVTFYAVVDAVYYFSLWHITLDSESLMIVNNILPPEVKANILATVVELVMGLLLIFKGKFIAQKIFMLAR